MNKLYLKNTTIFKIIVKLVLAGNYFNDRKYKIVTWIHFTDELYIFLGYDSYWSPCLDIYNKFKITKIDFNETFTIIIEFLKQFNRYNTMRKQS